jgi:serine protease
MSRPLNIFILFILSFSKIAAQQGEFIIQLDRGMVLPEHNVTLKQNGALVYHSKQISSEPMNLWLLSPEASARSSMNTSRPYLIQSYQYISKNKKLQSRKSPNDSLYNKQWQFKNIGQTGGVFGADLNIETAWDITTGGITATGDTIVIAIIDDGVDINHEDLRENIWVNRREIPGDKIDNDGNGYVDDINGWHVTKNSGSINTEAGHGTSVAGLAGARGNNKLGITGVNWNVKLLPISYGNATEANAISAYAYAYKLRKEYNESNGKRGAYIVVTNSSWGIDNVFASDAPLWCAMYDSLGKVGILSIGATANKNTNVEEKGDLPTTCGSEYLLTVTNLNKFDNKVSSAGFGSKSIDLACYGEESFTITTSNRYRNFSGTSAAAPQVAGAVALAYSVSCNRIATLSKSNPAAAALYVKDVLLNYTKPLSLLNSITVTGGKLDVGTSISQVQKECGGCIMPSGLIATSSTNGKETHISWVASGSKTIIRYRKEGSTTWKTDSVSSGNNITIKNLEYCTPYEYQLKTRCAGIADTWTYLKTIKTDGCCEAPKDVVFTTRSGEVTISEGSNLPSTLIFKKQSSSLWDTLRFTSTAILGKLPTCHLYEYTMTKYCSSAQSQIAYNSVKSFFTDCGQCTQTNYCTPAKQNNSAEWIAQVDLGSLKNRSLKDVNGFGDYRGVILPEVVRLDSLQIDITPGYQGTAFEEFFQVYIDYNQNGSFLDPSELVIKSDLGVKEKFSKKIKIPATALKGVTRMRIIMTYEQPDSPCDTKAEFGEIEEYCIKIKESVSSRDIHQLNASLKISPNPNNGNFSIETNTAFKDIEIYDAIGKKVYQGEFKNQLHLSAILPSSGIYTIKSINSTGYKTEKMVVIKE